MRLSTPLMGAVPRTNAKRIIEKPKAPQENRLIRIDNVVRFYMHNCWSANVWFAIAVNLRHPDFRRQAPAFPIDRLRRGLTVPGQAILLQLVMEGGAANAQRDDVQRRHLEPVVQIFAKPSRRHLLGQISIGGSLREALRSIPEEFAEAVELHDVHGLKYLEIAQITSVPLGRVMSRISRGRRLLAGLLAVTAEEEEGTLRKARGR